MNKINTSQAEQLREIVAYLKQKRLEQSLSLEQIASRTLIRLHILQALEAAEVENLPELIYIQGFIRRYGEVLKIDGDSLARQLSQESRAVATIPPSPPQSKPAPSPELVPSQEKSVIKWRSWPVTPIIGGLAVILGLFYALYRPPATKTVNQSSADASVTQVQPPRERELTPKTNPVTTQVKPSPETELTPKTEPVTTQVKPSPETELTPKTEPVTTQVKPSPETELTPKTEQVTTQVKPSPETELTPKTEPVTTQVKPSPETVTEKPAPVVNSSPSVTTSQINAPLSVAVALEGASWVKVEVDGKTEYEGILEEGTQKTWTASENLTIKAGNAGAVSYSVNQAPSQKLGKPGEVKTVTLTPNSR